MLPAAVLIGSLLFGRGALAARIEVYALRAPGDAHDIEQGSGLHYGRLGAREGLWLVCDRNGDQSASRIFFISKDTLASAEHRGKVVADAAFELAPPAGPWSEFAAAHRGAGEAALADVQKRIAAGSSRNGEPVLDIEAVTIAPSPTPPHEPHVFVVAEEPHSTVLELTLDEKSRPPRMQLVAAYGYAEAENEHGTANNDGLEGLAYAGTPGQVYWAEEGTKLHRPGAHPRLCFLDPRIGRAALSAGRVRLDKPASEGLTRAVRAQRRGRMQTLNALTATSTGQVLAVDRNGGWVLRINPKTAAATPWLNLYDLEGTNLRETLAEFPGTRVMSYISIEGIAVEPSGTIWLVDDPAMPEAFRASCLLRLTDLPRQP